MSFPSAWRAHGLSVIRGRLGRPQQPDRDAPDLDLGPSLLAGAEPDGREVDHLDVERAIDAADAPAVFAEPLPESVAVYRPTFRADRHGGLDARRNRTRAERDLNYLRHVAFPFVVLPE